MFLKPNVKNGPGLLYLYSIISCLPKYYLHYLPIYVRIFRGGDSSGVMWGDRGRVNVPIFKYFVWKCSESTQDSGHFRARIMRKCFGSVSALET